MALELQDIFPLSTTQGTAATARLLEPYSSKKELYMPTYNTLTQSRVVYTKRVSHPYYMFQYDYKNLMSWEYQLIEDFYRRMKGKYESFYVVDWSAPYSISASTVSSVTIDRIGGLEAATGYGGNTLLVYNAHKSGTNKQILTIDASEVFADTTIAMNETVSTTVAANSAKLYILYVGMFDSDKIQGTPVDTCIQKNVINYAGYGYKSMFGSILDVTIPIIQVGVMK